MQHKRKQIGIILFTILNLPDTAAVLSITKTIIIYSFVYQFNNNCHSIYYEVGHYDYIWNIGCHMSLVWRDAR